MNKIKQKDLTFVYRDGGVRARNMAWLGEARRGGAGHEYGKEQGEARPGEAWHGVSMARNKGGHTK